VSTTPGQFQVGGNPHRRERLLQTSQVREARWRVTIKHSEVTQPLLINHIGSNRANALKVPKEFSTGQRRAHPKVATILVLNSKIITPTNTAGKERLEGNRFDLDHQQTPLSFSAQTAGTLAHLA
jgi:hypothetical protein